jgi:hypothetical protein
VIITLVFEKNANFFSPKIWKNRRKLWSSTNLITLKA